MRASRVQSLLLSEAHLAAVPPFDASLHEVAPPRDLRPATEPELQGLVQDAIRGAPRDAPFLVFAYGSLIWNTPFTFLEERVATCRGWRRAFCLGWDTFFRGCIERPGLMLALDRGGQCTGVTYRLDRKDLEAQLMALMRREVLIMPNPLPPRWITIEMAGTKMRALTFVIDRAGDGYVHGLEEADIARILARAAGPRGTMAQYLQSTFAHLAHKGIHDGGLYRLQALVAHELTLNGAEPTDAVKS